MKRVAPRPIGMSLVSWPDAMKISGKPEVTE